MRPEDLTDYFKLREVAENPLEIVRFRTKQTSGRNLRVKFVHAPELELRGGCADFHMFHRIFLRDEYRLRPLKSMGLDCVVDLGANVGLFSACAAALARRVLAFEPFGLNYECLLKNTAACGNVEALCEAVAGQPGTLRLYRPRESAMTGAFSTFQEIAQVDQAAYDEVPATTLDQIFQRFQIERCDLLKIDIEGREYEVLHAASDETLGRTRRIYGEYHDVEPEDPRTRIGAFREFLQAKGYAVDLVPHHRKPNHGMFYAVREGQR